MCSRRASTSYGSRSRCLRPGVSVLSGGSAPRRFVPRRSCCRPRWWSAVSPPPAPPPLRQGNYYSRADSAPHSGILRHWLIPALTLNLGPWWPALVAAAVVGPLVCLFSNRDRVIVAAALIALASLVAYTLTPV